MNCPKCGQRTYVTNSRHADSTGYRVNQALLSAAEEHCSWYTRDWVVRKRECRDEDCDFEDLSFELLLSDFADMMHAASNGESPWGRRGKAKTCED